MYSFDDEYLEQSNEGFPLSGGKTRASDDAVSKDLMLSTSAITTLNDGTVDGSQPTNPEIHKMLADIRTWWFKASDTVNNVHVDPVFSGRAEHAMSWCICVAKEAIVAEREFISKSKPTHDLNHTFNWVSQCFRQLEVST